MQRTAEIAAQIFTARDLLLREQLEDDRVAFILLDSAAETLMIRSLSSGIQMGMWDSERFWYSHLDEVVQIDLNDMSQRDRETARAERGYVKWQLSETQKRNIDRDFSAKVRFLAWQGHLPIEYMTLLGRLHEYRNEMYHRDETRPKALRIMVHLYAWLVADLLERLRSGWFMWSSSDPEDLLPRTYVRMGIAAPTRSDWSGDVGKAIHDDMARSLRQGLRLGTAPELLADYVQTRVERLHDQMTFCAGYIADMWDDPVFNEKHVVRLIYAPPLTRGRAALDKVRAPVTRRMIASWDAAGQQIRVLTDPLDALHALARFENEFEHFESKVEELASQIDGAIQEQIDWARGK